MSSDPEPNAPNNNNLSHHVRHEYCHNRPSYRASRKQTAVKAYSVASESRHLLVFGVPQIDLLRELKVEFRRYGTVQLVQNVTEAVKATGSGALCLWLQKRKGEIYFKTQSSHKFVSV
ncbi:RNA-binding protein 48 [Culex quinquefasciatus]|uniref:RNA-binding protein 48 n=1 Tax=Culex quinquefasciatus TaxID=7176 RepID=UPI0018E2CF12|nr:RNA-binding protein 48 [Culex quinquefasciatus]